MTWVKVCGIRRRSDLAAAEEAGADAVGLVLAASSPRRLDPPDAAKLAAAAGIDTFLVMVDATPAEVIDLASFVGVTGVQLHGRSAAEAAAAATRAGLRVLRPVRVGDSAVTVDHVPADQVPLLDTGDSVLHGGTGRQFDRSRVGRIERRWVMAGGLGPDTVADAVSELGPWGVDASSRLESEPGVKDPDLIRRFVAEAKQA